MNLWLGFLPLCALTGFGVTVYQWQRLGELKSVDEELDRRVEALSQPLRGSGMGVRGGPGIGPEDLPNVFKRFYRADQSRARADGRSGLGLAICQAITDAHGGTIEVASKLGEGTIFTVRLPA